MFAIVVRRYSDLKLPSKMKNMCVVLKIHNLSNCVLKIWLLVHDIVHMPLENWLSIILQFSLEKDPRLPLKTNWWRNTPISS